MLTPKGGDPMTPERDFDLQLENDVASATEFTGMLPAIATHNDPEALAAAMDVPANVIAAREDPACSPQPNGNAHPCGAHNQQKTTPGCRPAKAPGPYRPD